MPPNPPSTSLDHFGGTCPSSYFAAASAAAFSCWLCWVRESCSITCGGGVSGQTLRVGLPAGWRQLDRQLDGDSWMDSCWGGGLLPARLTAAARCCWNLDSDWPNVTSSRAEPSAVTPNSPQANARWAPVITFRPCASRTRGSQRCSASGRMGVFAEVGAHHFRLVGPCQRARRHANGAPQLAEHWRRSARSGRGQATGVFCRSVAEDHSRGLLFLRRCCSRPGTTTSAVATCTPDIWVGGGRRFMRLVTIVRRAAGCEGLSLHERAPARRYPRLPVPIINSILKERYTWVHRPCHVGTSSCAHFIFKKNTHQ